MALGGVTMFSLYCILGFVLEVERKSEIPLQMEAIRKQHFMADIRDSIENADYLLSWGGERQVPENQHSMLIRELILNNKEKFDEGSKKGTVSNIIVAIKKSDEVMGVIIEQIGLEGGGNGVCKLFKGLPSGQLMEFGKMEVKDNGHLHPLFEIEDHSAKITIRDKDRVVNESGTYIAKKTNPLTKWKTTD